MWKISLKLDRFYDLINRPDTAASYSLFFPFFISFTVLQKCAFKLKLVMSSASQQRSTNCHLFNLFLNNPFQVFGDAKSLQENPTILPGMEIQNLLPTDAKSCNRHSGQHDA